MSDKLFWIDIETTGLDPHYDKILEIGFVITDLDMNILSKNSWVVLNKLSDTFIHNMDDIVSDMHEKNKLFEECNSLGVARPWHQIEDEIKFWLMGNGANQQPLCGSSVAFDRGFLKAQAPELDLFFHYRSIDISSLKELCKRYNPVLYAQVDSSTSRRKLHRAIPDIEDTISEGKFYLDNFLYVT